MKRSMVPGFSMQECLDERRQQERRREYAQSKGKENGEKLLSQLLESESGIMEFRIAEGDDANYQRWLHNCRDIIRAAANSNQRFRWNDDWRNIGFLTIGVISRKLAA